MMPKNYFLRGLLALPAVALLMSTPISPAQDKTPPPGNAAGASSSQEELFDKALLAMSKRAQELNIKGVALVAFAPGDTVQSWSSKMVVVGNLKTPTTDKDKGSNLLGIAYAKAAEMADTLKDSGSKVRAPLTGENGWEGGVTARGKIGQLIAAFSGGVSADDVKVSRAWPGHPCHPTLARALSSLSTLHSPLFTPVWPFPTHCNNSTAPSSAGRTAPGLISEAAIISASPAIDGSCSRCGRP